MCRHAGSWVCGAWLSSSGMRSTGEGDVEADPGTTDSDSSGPEAPATEPVEPAPRRSGMPSKRKLSDELAFGRGAGLTHDAGRGIDAVLKLEGECAAFMVPVSGGADASAAAMLACGVVDADADAASEGAGSDNDDVESRAAHLPAVGGDTAERRDWVVKKAGDAVFMLCAGTYTTSDYVRRWRVACRRGPLS